jgi:hypothetical protein
MTNGRAVSTSLLAMIGALYLALPAVAQQAQTAPSRVAITPSDCSNIQVYKTPPGVKYQPGVDAQGRAVAPADLGNRQRIEPPKEIVIEITRQLPGLTAGSGAGGAAKAPGAATGANSGVGSGAVANRVQGYDSKAYLGYVTVKDGQVYYNGQPVGDQDARAIAEACARQMPR